jgi:hypothetical protein
MGGLLLDVLLGLASACLYVSLLVCIGMAAYEAARRNEEEER